MQNMYFIKKNNSITIWRIFFAYIIVIFHFFNSYGKGSSLYIATDFFFIVSGFFVAKEASENVYENSFAMIKYKIKKYYPHYLFSLVVGILAYMIFQNGALPSGREIVTEFTFISMIGINVTKMINVPTWYLSVLLISSYVIYFLYQNYKKLFVGLICPATIVIIGTWFYRNLGYLSHSVLGESTTTGIYWNRPLFLGFAMMCLGVVGYELLRQGLSLNMGGFCRIIEVILFLSVPIGAIIFRFTSFDFVMVAMLFIGIVQGFRNGTCKLAESRVIKYLSRLSYPLYLNHNMFRELIPCYVKQFSVAVFVIYLVLVTLYSMLTMLIIDKVIISIERKCKNGKHNYSSCTSKRK